MYLTTEYGNTFTLPPLSLAYYYVGNTYCEGSLNKVKIWNVRQSQTFFEKNNIEGIKLGKTNAYNIFFKPIVYLNPF